MELELTYLIGGQVTNKTRIRRELLLPIHAGQFLTGGSVKKGDKLIIEVIEDG
jgi:hypothetical protein